MAGKRKKSYEIGELDHYLFGQGNHYEIYKKLGAHKVCSGKKTGVYFAVWAPHAKSVTVVGEFNDWDMGEPDGEGRTSRYLYMFYTGRAGRRDV